MIFTSVPLPRLALAYLACLLFALLQDLLRVLGLSLFGPPLARPSPPQPSGEPPAAPNPVRLPAPPGSLAHSAFWHGVALDRPNLSAAVMHYLLDTAGLMFFATWPALALHTPWLALLGGLLYGAGSRAGFLLTRLPANPRAALHPADLAARAASAALAACGAYALATLLG